MITYPLRVNDRSYVSVSRKKQTISTKVLPLSQIDTHRELSRTPLRQPVIPPKDNENIWLFDELALDALAELANVAKGSPMAPKPCQDMA